VYISAATPVQSRANPVKNVVKNHWKMREYLRVILIKSVICSTFAVEEMWYEMIEKFGAYSSFSHISPKSKSEALCCVISVQYMNTKLVKRRFHCAGK